MTSYIDTEFSVKVLKFGLSQLFSSYNKKFGLATTANQPVILDPGCGKISLSLYQSGDNNQFLKLEFGYAS